MLNNLKIGEFEDLKINSTTLQSHGITSKQHHSNIAIQQHSNTATQSLSIASDYA
jgi:hypothetical protein